MDILREYQEKVLNAHKPKFEDMTYMQKTELYRQDAGLYRQLRDEHQRADIEIWEDRDPLTMTTSLTATAMVMGKRCYSRVMIPDRDLMMNAEDAYNVARERLIRQLEDFVRQEIERSTEIIEVRGDRDNQVLMTFRR